MHTLLKFLLATILAFSTTFANAAFIPTTSGAGTANYGFDELTGTGLLRYETEKIGGYGYIQIEDTFTSAGIYSFDWMLYDTGVTNNPTSGGYLLNGVKFELGFVLNGNAPLTGSTSVALAAGDTFGWYLETTQRGSRRVEFSLRNASFVSSPSAVPVPAAAWLFGSALLGFAGLRRKQHA